MRRITTALCVVLALACAGPAASRTPDNAVDAYINGLVDAGKLPGAEFTVAKNGRIVHSVAFGYADLASRKKVAAGQTIFGIASVEKFITALTVLKLIQDDTPGLTLDTKIAPILARVPQPTGTRPDPRFAQITVRMLLSLSFKKIADLVSH